MLSRLTSLPEIGTRRGEMRTRCKEADSKAANGEREARLD